MNARFITEPAQESGLHGQGRQQAVVNESASTTPSSKRRSSRFERWLLRRLLAAAGDPPMTLVLWDGQEIVSEASPAMARVRIANRSTLWKLVIDPCFEFCEAYADGRLEVEGDVAALLTATFQRLNQGRSSETRLERFSRWFRRPRGTSLFQSRDNIHHHYDLGNAFYRLWLDEGLVYTCAYFADRWCSLKQAQLAKMDYVCRKLRLQPGETVLEAGCGWGELAMYMADRYGVTVKAFNIAQEQVAYAREQARQRGLQSRVDFVEDDWRRMNDRCDAFVSVGMLEHVGRKNYRLLGDVIHRCLRKGGRGLIHSIGRNSPQRMSPWIERRIFPGGYPPTLGEAMRIFEPHGFSVLDVENLRLHYAETLRHWLVRYERSVDAVRNMFNERFVRMWRMYLASSIAAFECGNLQLFQIFFAPGSKNDIPWTRAALYATDAEDSEHQAGASPFAPKRPR